MLALQRTLFACLFAFLAATSFAQDQYSLQWPQADWFKNENDAKANSAHIVKSLTLSAVRTLSKDATYKWRPPERFTRVIKKEELLEDYGKAIYSLTRFLQGQHFTAKNCERELTRANRILGTIRTIDEVHISRFSVPFLGPQTYAPIDIYKYFVNARRIVHEKSKQFYDFSEYSVGCANAIRVFNYIARMNEEYLLMGPLRPLWKDKEEQISDIENYPTIFDVFYSHWSDHSWDPGSSWMNTFAGNVEGRQYFVDPQGKKYRPAFVSKKDIKEKKLKPTTEWVKTGRRFSFDDLQNGDVFLDRGHTAMTSSITQIGEFPAHYSHTGLIFKDKSGKPHLVESLIEVGLHKKEINWEFLSRLARFSVYRYRGRTKANELGIAGVQSLEDWEKLPLEKRKSIMLKVRKKASALSNKAVESVLAERRRLKKIRDAEETFFDELGEAVPPLKQYNFAQNYNFHRWACWGVPYWGFLMASNDDTHSDLLDHDHEGYPEPAYPGNSVIRLPLYRTKISSQNLNFFEPAGPMNKSLSLEHQKRTGVEEQVLALNGYYDEVYKMVSPAPGQPKKRVKFYERYIYAPADIEVDPRFDHIWEYRNATLLQDTLLKDMILKKIYQWVTEKNYFFDYDPLHSLAGEITTWIRRQYIIGNLLKSFMDTQITDDQVALTIGLEVVTNKILDLVKEQNKKYRYWRKQQAYYLGKDRYEIDPIQILVPNQIYRMLDILLLRDYVAHNKEFWIQKEEVEDVIFHNLFHPKTPWDIGSEMSRLDVFNKQW